MPDPTPDLRQQIADACRQLEHDNRSYLKPVLLAIVDALEAGGRWGDVGSCILCLVPGEIVHNDHACGCSVEAGPCSRHQMLFKMLSPRLASTAPTSARRAARPT